MNFSQIFEAFYQNHIRYLVVGGMAVNFHGVPRTTMDIDIIIYSGKENVISICRVLAELGFIPRLPVDPEDLADPETLKDWIENRNMKAFSFYQKSEVGKVIDIVLVHPLDFEISEKRKVDFDFWGVKIPVLSIDDLIIMKEVSGRPKDISDAEMLKEARKVSEDSIE